MSTDPKNLAAKYKIQSPTTLDPKSAIMVIEDQVELRLIVTHQLQKLSFTSARQASNGYEALEIIREEKLKLGAIICDMEMPVMGGIDFLSELRENPDFDVAPFCITMDNVTKEKMMLAVENGTDEILVKPFTLGDIGPKLRAAFSKFHLPNNPEKVYELAKQMMRDNKLDLSAAIYKDLGLHAPKAARPLVGLARIEIKKGNMAEALKLLVEAEGKNPNFVHTYVERGVIYSKQSEWDQAVLCFKKAIELSPLNAHRYKMAADILFPTKKYAEACELLESALKYNLDFPDLYKYLCQAKFALKDYKLAQKYIKQALQANPENVDYLNQLGICLKETNQVDEALKVYNQAIKIDPNNIDSLYNKAVLVKSKHDYDEAIKLFERVIKKDPTFTLAKTKLEECRKEKAALKPPAAPAA